MDPKLYEAALLGNLRYFENLINVDLHKLVQTTSDQKNTVLHVAAKYGEKQTAEKIIDLCQPLFHETNSKGDSPLHIAARLGNLEMVKLLINRAKVTEVEEEKKLLKMVNLKGDTALHEAVKNRHVQVVKLLIDEDQQLTTVTNNDEESPLFTAVDREFYEIALHILNSSPVCSYRGRNGMNVLHALIIREIKTFEFQGLLSFLPFSSPEKLFRHGLQSAQLIKSRVIGPNNPYSNLMSEVLRRNSSTLIAEADKFGWIPLHYAAYLGNSNLVEQLLDLDISIADVKDKEGMSALHIAAKEGHIFVIIKLLLKCPHIPEFLDNKGRTALHVAAESGNRRTVYYLLTQPDFDDLINAQDNDGNTAFHLAALQEHGEICRFLASNARIDKWVINKEGLSPFDIAKLKNPLLPQGVKSLELSSRKVKSYDTKIVKDKEEAAESTPKFVKEVSNVVQLVSTIIASVTFAAAITMPGGYISDSKENPGTAINIKKSAFGVFVIANTIAFVSAASSMLLPFVLGTIMTINESAVKALSWCGGALIYSIYSLIIAFLSATYVVLGTSPVLAIAAIVVGVVFFLAIFVPINRALKP